MAANNIYIQVDLNSQTAQQNVNALNQAISQTGPTSEKASAQATAGLGRVNVAVNQTISAFGGLTNALAGLGIVRMVEQLVRVGSEMGRAQMMMAQFVDNADDARKVMEGIREVASQSIFSFKDLQEAARQLAGFNFEAKDIPATLKIITDQVTAMGGQIGNVGTIVRLFGRIMNKEFLTAEDLMRALPKQGVQVMEALRQAMTAQLNRPVVTDEVRKWLKEGVMSGPETIAIMLKAMKDQTGGAGAQISDLAKMLKNLGDAFDVLRQKIMSDEGFGRAFSKLGEEVMGVLKILAAFAQWLMDLPEPVKEVIVNVVALSVAFGAFNLVMKIVPGVVGPAVAVLRSLAGVLALMSPEALAVAAGVAGIGVILADRFPEQAKKLKDSAVGWGKTVWETMQSTISTLAEKSGLLPKGAKVPDLTMGTGKPGQENLKDKLDDVQAQVDEWSLAASKTLLLALSSPVEAVAFKYKELFEKLDKLMHDKLITGAAAQRLSDQLTAAQKIEMDSKVIEKERQRITDLAKQNQERIKGSYDAQILYIEAADEQDLRKKIANLARITELRIKSNEEVAAQQKGELQVVLDEEVAMINAHRADFAKQGYTSGEVDALIQARKDEVIRKQKGIDIKAVDETQKYRIEGWKKANDIIIEDQKRIYEAFKGEFDEIFDAFTQKGKTIGQAMGDVFKKLFLGEAKQLFSSTLAQSATELAGYGRPEVQYSRGGGIISALFQKGMTPRPPGAPPASFIPEGLGLSDFKPAYETTEAAKMVQPANLFIVGVDAFNKATQDFLLAVQQFAAAGGAGEGGGLAAMGIPAPSLATGWGMAGGGGGRYGSIIQQASAASGVSPQIIRAVISGESAGDPIARSLKGARGLMQLMPGTASDMGVTDVTDPLQNVTGGARYLGQLMKRYPGDLSAALAAYNMGPAAYDRAVRRGTPLPRETQAYVPRVMQALKQLGGADVAVQVATGGAPAFSMDQFAGLPTRLSAVSAPEIALPELAGMGGGGMAPGVPAGVSGAGALFGGAAVPFGLGAISMGALTVGAMQQPDYNTKTQSEMAKVAGAALGGAGGGGSGLGGILGKPGAGAKGGGIAGFDLSKLKDQFGIGTTSTGGTTFGSVVTSPGVANLSAIAGGMLISGGLKKHSAVMTTAGGALMGPQLAQMFPGLGFTGGILTGAGLGLVGAGLQKGGVGGMLMDIGGGALAGATIGGAYFGPAGALIGGAIGAAAGAVAGTVRLFIKTEQEKIRAQIKQVYGVDISNRQILTQIQQIVDQKYGGNVQVGIHGQDIQDLVRLYALSSGQAANLPRPMYNATIAQSTQGVQLQPTYNGGVQVQNPYTGTTSYQYAHAAITAQGANPSPGSGLGVPGAAGLINNQFQQLTLQTIQGNPSAIAMASASAATAGDSRLTTAAAMQEPLTALS
jgi:soluble lytic murein transglycosylase-like protein